MSEGGLSPERLAMLLDGRLPPGEREQLLSELAADPERVADLASAAVALREAAPAGGTATAASTPRVPHWQRWRPLLAAATIVVAAGIGAGVWHALVPGSASEGHFAPIAGMTPRLSLPDDWSDAPWMRTRGVVATSEMRAVSAVLGARAADLEFALRHAPARVPDLVGAMTELVRSMPGSGPVLAQWEAAYAASVGSTPEHDRIDAARAALEDLADPAYYQLGVVVGGIRLALLVGDDVALESLSRRLAAVGDRPGLDEPVRREVARLAEMLRATEGGERSRDRRLRAVDDVFRVVLQGPSGSV